MNPFLEISHSAPKVTEQGKQPDFESATRAGLAAGSGVGAFTTARSGISDLANKNVLITYGAGPGMGAGHKSPAKQLEKLVQEIIQEAPENSFLKKIKITDAPVVSYSGDVLPETIKEIKRKGKFLTGIDTGWGLFDPERVHQNDGYYKSLEGLKKRFTGDVALQRDPLLLRRFKNFILFQPDGRSDATGYKVTGDAARLRQLGDYTQLTYGNFDPRVAYYKSKGKLRFVGKAHPLIEPNLNTPLAEGDYKKLVLNYLRNAGYDLSDDALKGKDIYTVSGASRGDTVGARARWLDTKLRAKGVNPDSYIILGVGGGDLADPNATHVRERAIAGSSLGKNKGSNIFIGPKLNSSKEFVDIINNSKLHIMGMGGSGPPEVLAHGGAPVAVFDDEQVFKGKGPESWAKGTLDQTKGIQSFERRLIDRINRFLPKDKQLSYSAPRDWMNMQVWRDPKTGKDIVTRRGLDGIREYLDIRGVGKLKSDDPKTLYKFLDDLDFMDKAKWKQTADLVRSDIAQGRSVTKSILKEKLLEARKAALRSGGFKLFGAAGLSALSLASLLDLYRKKKEALNKEASVNENKAEIGQIASGLGIGALGLGLNDTANSLEKVRGLAKPYQKAIREYLKKYPGGFWHPDPQRMRDFLDVMDLYADSAKAMSNLRIMGIPAKYLTGRFPLSGILENPKNAVLFGLGLESKVPEAKLWRLKDQAEHYRLAGKAPRQLLAREMLGDAASEIFSPKNDVNRVLGGEQIARIIEAPENISLRQRFEPYIKSIEENKILGKDWDKVSPFATREHRMIRGLENYEIPEAFNAKEIWRKARNDGIYGYGVKIPIAARRIIPKLRLGALLTVPVASGMAGLGLLNMLEKSEKFNNS